MHNTLRNLLAGRDLDDETLNNSRSTVTSDSVRGSTVLVSVTLSETSESLREPRKPYTFSTACDDKPPQLPFSLLFFAHLGWGPKLHPESRSND